MPILTIKHVTTYRYKQPVAFGEHRMMLLPRDDDDQIVLESALAITPEPSELAWTRDAFGNHVATASFAQRSSELRFESNIRVDHLPAAFSADAGDGAAAHGDDARLAPGLASSMTSSSVVRWTAEFLRDDGSADTGELLIDMTQSIRRTFKHVARHVPGIQSPQRTLELGSGSCRDLAMLMIAALRSLGIAARFVSGYLHLPGHEDDAESLSGGNTHAWVQAHVPGAGWIDFDPSSGMSGNQNLVRVAVVDEPRDASPLQGSWIGAASDHLAMKVAVKVRAASTE